MEAAEDKKLNIDHDRLIRKCCEISTVEDTNRHNTRNVMKILHRRITNKM